MGNKKILVEAADTPQKKQQGLSGREKLNDNQGMLFDFPNDDGARPGFWMKDMLFDLDIIWIKNNPSTSSGRIISITPNVPAPFKDKGLGIKDKHLPLYYPPDEIDQVLEVNAGWSRENEVEVGDEVRF